MRDERHTNDQESPLVARMLEFFQQWEVDFDSMCRSFYEIFAPDTVWQNPGAAPTCGPDEAIDRVMRPARVGPLNVETIRVEVLGVAEARGVVYTERIDHLVRPDGTISVSIPVAGVSQFGPDGRIRRWAEYADVTSALSQAGVA